MSVKNKTDKKNQGKAHAPAETKTAPAGASAFRRHPHPGLGRGLDSLIGGSSPVAVPQPSPAVQKEHAEIVQSVAAAPVPESVGQADISAAQLSSSGRAVLEVPIAEISRSPWQPRQTFDEAALKELTDSIKSAGVLAPLICRKTADGHYELISGERRLRASNNAGLTKVPVILVDAADRQAAEMAIIENIQRQDLNIIEEAEGYRTLSEKFSLTQQEVADRVGKARPSVANALRLLDLPDEVKQLIGSGLLSLGHAKVLLGLADANEQTLLGRKSVTDGLSVRALERVIARRKMEAANEQPVHVSRPDLPESYIRDLSDRMHQRFGTSVRITSGVTHANGKHTKGLLEIDFYDNDDLERILTLLGVSPNAD